MKHNKNLIKDIEKLQKIEQQLYDELKKISNHTPEPIKCASGFSGPNKEGNCVAYWSPNCGLECHKKKCADSGGKWIKKDFWSNPYTCRPSGHETRSTEMKENEEKKKKIMEKINEISKIRINLYQRLKDKFNYRRLGLKRNYGNLKDKAQLLYNTEKKMNAIKKEINSRKKMLETKVRVVEVNEKLLEDEIINKSVLKIMLYISFFTVLAILLGKVPAIPIALTYLLVIVVFSVGLFKILKMKYYQYAEDGLYRKDYYYLGNTNNNSVVLYNKNQEDNADIGNVLAGLGDDYSSIMDGKLLDTTVVKFDAYENFTPGANDIKYTGNASSV